MGEIVKYEAEGLEGFSVLLDSETVWLTQAQTSILFDRDRTVIGRHIRNVFAEEELEENEVCAFFAHTTQHGAMADKTQTTSMQYYFKKHQKAESTFNWNITPEEYSHWLKIIGEWRYETVIKPALNKLL